MRTLNINLAVETALKTFYFLGVKTAVKLEGGSCMYYAQINSFVRDTVCFIPKTESQRSKALQRYVSKMKED